MRRIILGAAMLNSILAGSSLAHQNWTLAAMFVITAVALIVVRGDPQWRRK